MNCTESIIRFLLPKRRHPSYPSTKSLNMETQYVKQTVGPVLTSALTSLVLHAPYTPNPSSYSSTIDPINYIGQYLLEYVKKQKEQNELEKNLEENQKLVQDWKETQQREKKNRLKLEEDLVERVIVIRIKMEEEEKNAVVLEPVVEAAVEVPFEKPEQENTTAESVTEQDLPENEEEGTQLQSLE
jgi:hypothetical protein